MHTRNLPHLNIDLSQASARSQLNVNSDKYQKVLHCRVVSAKPEGGSLEESGAAWKEEASKEAASLKASSETVSFKASSFEVACYEASSFEAASSEARF